MSKYTIIYGQYMKNICLTKDQKSEIAVRINWSNIDCKLKESDTAQKFYYFGGLLFFDLCSVNGSCSSCKTSFVSLLVIIW